VLAAAAALFAASARASNAPLPNISLDVEKGFAKSDSDSSSSGKKSKDGTRTETSGDDVIYTITVENDGDTTASGVEIDYVVYNRTISTDNGTVTKSMDNITGSETVDVPANDKKDVQTDPISHKDSTTYAKQARGVMGATAASSSRQEIMGIWVQAKLGDNVLTTYEEPMDIKETMDQKAAQSGGGDSSN
jgi:hypothetical protein